MIRGGLFLYDDKGTGTYYNKITIGKYDIIGNSPALPLNRAGTWRSNNEAFCPPYKANTLAPPLIIYDNSYTVSVISLEGWNILDERLIGNYDIIGNKQQFEQTL